MSDCKLSGGVDLACQGQILSPCLVYRNHVKGGPHKTKLNYKRYCSAKLLVESVDNAKNGIAKFRPLVSEILTSKGGKNHQNSKLSADISILHLHCVENDWCSFKGSFFIVLRLPDQEIY